MQALAVERTLAMDTQKDQPKGRGKGGAARAAKLTPEQRSEIARKGAAARKARALDDERGQEDVITHVGELTLGAFTVPCFVTKSGERLIASRKMQEILKVVEDEPEDREKEQRPGTRFKRFLTRKFFNSLISQKDLQDLFAPIRRSYRGRVINGYKAESLTKFCELMTLARDRQLLTTERQYIVAEQAKVLYDAFAKIGLTALIDEATGFQQVRSKDNLRKLLEAYVAPEFLPWTKRFPDEFYRELFRLRGWSYDPLSVKRPILIGKLTEHIIYKRLPPGVLEELKAKNPKTESGYRKKKHHQLLTVDVGHPHLDRQIASSMTLMRISSTWTQFDSHLKKAFPVPGETPDLFGEEEA
jgi:hypothetical protein